MTATEALTNEKWPTTPEAIQLTKAVSISGMAPSFGQAKEKPITTREKLLMAVGTLVVFAVIFAAVIIGGGK